MNMRIQCAATAAIALSAMSASAADLTIVFDDGSGMSAEADFTLLGGGNMLEIALRNTSTNPAAISSDASDQLLTTLSWDFGQVGANAGDATITGGSAVFGPTSNSVNFSGGAFGPGTDAGGEWGFGNTNGTAALQNIVSGNAAQTTDFGGPNLDGPPNRDGPQAGLISPLSNVALGGLGAIENEIVMTLTLDQVFTDIDDVFGDLRTVRVEYGSDAYIIDERIPAPATAAPLAVAGCICLRRRR